MHSRSGEPCENEPPRAYALIQPPIFGRRADATLGDNCSGDEEKKIDDFLSPPRHPNQREREEEPCRLIVESPLCPSSLRDSLYLSLFFFFLRIIIERKRTYDINLKNGKGEGDRESKIKGTLDFARFMYVCVYVR